MIPLGLSLLFTPIPVSEIVPFNLYFVDVGYGDAIVLQLPEGEAMLIDGGKPEAAPKIIAQLEKLGIQTLSTLIMTHFHKDHVGGLFPILEKYLPREAEVFAPFTPEEVGMDQMSEEIVPLIDALKRYSIKTLRRGAVLRPSPDLQIEVLHPDTLTGNQNEDSLVLKIVHGAVSFLLAADAGPNTQKKLLEIYGKQLQSDLIKIPHHANETETGQAFIDAVHPKIAILTIGSNPYDAPNPEILEAYKKTGARLYRTDYHGTIHMISDGQTLRPATERP